MTAAHSIWSASGFEQKMLCPGSHVLLQGLPNKSSQYAAEGTVAHLVFTWALQESKPASAYIGRVIEADGYTFEVTDDMASHVQVSVDYVTDLVGDTGVLFVDQRVNYSSYLDVPEQEAWGTADAIVAKGDEIIVVDLKYGMGVEVSAERNPQMSLYALGALQAYNGIVEDFSRVRMAITQPRVRKAPSEWDCSVEDLETWGRSTARSAVASCKNAENWNGGDHCGLPEWQSTFLRPTEKGCKFCRAKATCPALRQEVAETVAPITAEDFDDLTVAMPQKDESADVIAFCLTKVDLIEDWCKAIRAEAERRLLAGESVPGFKVVQGKKGSRKWVDEKAAEQMLKTFRLKQEEMYDFKLISPTTADKLAKAETIGKRQWPKLAELITQSEGKPHVAPADDPRPALNIKPVVDEFADVSDDLA